MISTGKAFDFAIKLNHILDHKTHHVDIEKIKCLLENEEMDLVDYLEMDYGNIAQFSFFDRNSRSEITHFFRDCVLSIDIERKWGIKNDGIGLLLACAVYLLWNVMDRDFGLLKGKKIWIN